MIKNSARTHLWRPLGILVLGKTVACLVLCALLCGLWSALYNRSGYHYLAIGRYIDLGGSRTKRLAEIYELVHEDRLRCERLAEIY